MARRRGSGSEGETTEPQSCTLVPAFRADPDDMEHHSRYRFEIDVPDAKPGTHRQSRERPATAGASVWRASFDGDVAAFRYPSLQMFEDPAARPAGTRGAKSGRLSPGGRAGVRGADAFRPRWTRSVAPPATAAANGDRQRRAARLEERLALGERCLRVGGGDLKRTPSRTGGAPVRPATAAAGSPSRGHAPMDPTRFARGMHPTTRAVYSDLTAGAHVKLERAMGKLGALNAAEKREFELVLQGAGPKHSNMRDCRIGPAETLRPQLAISHFQQRAARRSATAAATQKKGLQQVRGVVETLFGEGAIHHDYHAEDRSSGSEECSGEVVRITQDRHAAFYSKFQLVSSSEHKVRQKSVAVRLDAPTPHTACRARPRGHQTTALWRRRKSPNARRQPALAAEGGSDGAAQHSPRGEYLQRCVQGGLAPEQLLLRGPRGGRESTGGAKREPQRAVGVRHTTCTTSEAMQLDADDPAFAAAKRSIALSLSVAPTSRTTERGSMPSPSLTVAHFSIGNRLANAMAVSVPDALGARAGCDDGVVSQGEHVSAARVRSLDLSENRLDGDSLVAVLQQLAGPHSSALETLRLNGNGIQPAVDGDQPSDEAHGVYEGSAAAGMESVASLCSLLRGRSALLSLSRLELADTRLGLAGIHAIADALCGTYARKVGAGVAPIVHLDISRNALCDAAGASLSRVLGHHACTLQTVRAGWNRFAGDAAQELGEAISLNSSLTELDLGTNSLGSAAQFIARALPLNSSLRRLDLSHNSIPQDAALVIGYALCRSRSLIWLGLSSNPLGHDGGRAVVRALLRGVRLAPLGAEVDAPEPEGVDCAAVEMGGCIFTPQVGVGVKGSGLVRAGVQAHARVLFDPRAPEAGSPYSLDLSSPVDFVTASELLDAFSAGRADGGSVGAGARTVGELVGSCLVVGRQRQTMRFERGDATVGGIKGVAVCNDKASGKPWSIPNNGVFGTEFRARRRPKTAALALGPAGLRRLLSLVAAGEDPMTRRDLLRMALVDMVLLPKQAQRLVDGVAHLLEASEVVGLVMPAAAQCLEPSSELFDPSADDLFGFLRRNHPTGGGGLAKLISMVGFPLFRFDAHNPSGLWRLDLELVQHRGLATRLATIAGEEARHRQAQDRDPRNAKLAGACSCDTSQTRGWLNFRNSVFNGEDIDLTLEFFDRLPPHVRAELQSSGVLYIVSQTHRAPSCRAASGRVCWSLITCPRAARPRPLCRC